MKSILVLVISKVNSLNILLNLFVVVVYVNIVDIWRHRMCQPRLTRRGGEVVTQLSAEQPFTGSNPVRASILRA